MDKEESPSSLYEVDWVDLDVFNPAFIGGKPTSIWKLWRKESVVELAMPDSRTSGLHTVYQDSSRIIFTSTPLTSPDLDGGGVDMPTSSLERPAHDHTRSHSWTTRVIQLWNACIQKIRWWFCRQSPEVPSPNESEMIEQD